MRKYNLLSLLSLFIIAVTLFSCENDETLQEAISLSEAEISFAPGASSATVEVTSNTEWTASVFDAGENHDWITVSPASGSFDGTITISVAENGTEPRSAVVRVFSKHKVASVEIAQDAADAPDQDSPIADLRARYQGEDIVIDEDLVIEAVIISDYRNAENGGIGNSTSLKSIVVSDGISGIQLRCTEDNIEFAKNDKVSISLKGSTLSSYSGAIQINNLPLSAITKIGTEVLEPVEITAAELVSGEYESMYVKVKDVQVAVEDLAKTFVVSDAHTSIKIVAETGESFDLFSSRYSVFGNEQVPQGSGSLSGIAGINNGRYQLIISSRSDYAGMTGARFESAPTFSIEGSGVSVSGDAGSIKIILAANVEWNAVSSNTDFTLSQSSGSEGAIITVSYTDNPSSTDGRSATITFTTENAEIEDKTLTFEITQSPFEVLVEDKVQGWMELPAVAKSTGYAYIAHRTNLNGSDVRNYSMWYDTQNRLALWVAYPLYKDMMGESGRTDEWAYDPKMPKRYQAELYKSYGVDGYDRGHQLPSADRTATAVLNESTFYFTNMTPQNSSLNQGVWGTLEGKVRNWANGCDTLYVVTGAVLPQSGSIKYLQDNRGEDVAVPDAYYKVLLRYCAADASTNGGYSAIGFWFENRAYSGTAVTAEYARSVDEIESLTGFDFFTNLNETVEQTIEGAYTASEWGL